MSWCGYRCACGCGQRCECGRTQPDGEPLPMDMQQVRIEHELAQDDKRRTPPWPMSYRGAMHGIGLAPHHPAPANALGQVPVTCLTDGCDYALGHERRATKFTNLPHAHNGVTHSFEPPRKATP